MTSWRTALKRIPGAQPLGRWLRGTFHPHHRAVRKLERAAPGLLLQPEATTGAGRYPEIFAFLSRELAGIENPRVLSWGCSTGAELLALRAAVPHATIVGVDINPRSLARARRATAGVPDIRLIQSGDPADLAGQSFDAVVCLAVLRHARLQEERPALSSAILPFARADRFASALAGLVAPGGLLALWNVHFRFADMAASADFEAVLDLPKGAAANQPLYGPSDQRLDGATCTAAVYRRTRADGPGPAPDRGVLTYCYGPDPKYREQTLALARSIRLRNRTIPLAVATDRPAADFEGLFDRVIPCDFSAYPGTLAKLEMGRLSPFETTLFLDSDCLCLVDVARVLDHFGDARFAVFGANLPDFDWADGGSRVRELVPAPSYPAFNGGLYFFRRSPLADEVLAAARGFAARYDDLGLTRPRGRTNDELLISLAMAARGLAATPATDLVPMVAPELPARELELDVLAGRCRFIRRGQWVEPAIIHFVGPRDRLLAYRREQWKLRLIAGRGWPRWTAGGIALAVRLADLSERAGRRLLRLTGSA